MKINFEVSAKLRVVCHCFCRNDWHQIVTDQWKYLNGLEVFCTMIGATADEEFLRKLAVDYGLTLELRCFSDETTYEHEAMQWVQELAELRPDDFTLYFHTKGAANPTDINTAWRGYMNFHLLEKHSDRMKSLLARPRMDVTGVLFGMKRRDKDLTGREARFFAGNFWMARNRYLNRLPDYAMLRALYRNNRFLAERFIGWGNPRVILVDQWRTLPATDGWGGLYRKIKQLNKKGW